MITGLDYWALWVAETIEFLRTGNPVAGEAFEEAMVAHIEQWRDARRVA
jgi:hypothetical protein